MTRALVEAEIQHLDHNVLCENPYHEPRLAEVLALHHDCFDALWCGGCWSVYETALRPHFDAGTAAVCTLPHPSCGRTFASFDDWCTGVPL